MAMQRKQVLFVADGLDDAHLFRQVLGGLDVDVVAGGTSQLERLLSDNPGVSLLIFDSPTMARSLADLERLLSQSDGAALLAVVQRENLADLRLPVQVPRATSWCMVPVPRQCEAGAIRQLLWPGKESAPGDFITVDDMTIDLATYQVTVDGEPVDFTYLEYSLLSFLVHASRSHVFARRFAAPRVGLRLLRRLAHGRRPCQAHSREARSGAGAAFGDGARRGLSVVVVGALP